MWTAYGAGDDPDPEFWRRVSAPDNEIPVAVPLNVVLARTDEVAVALLSLHVYTTGVSADLAVRVRSGSNGGGLSELVFEHRPPSPGRFLLGVQFADGRRASNLPSPEPWPGRQSPDDIVFHAGGGGGGDRSVDQSWWLSPLPPDGPLTFVLSCGALGIAETSTVVDGSVLRRAAEDIVTLWPWTPPDHGEPPPPPPPDVPDGSWFAGPA